MAFLGVCVGLLLLEAVLVASVRRLRRDFQWLITEADEVPELDRTALKKFFHSSFDANLGWTRRPDTQGKEKGKHGYTSYRIDASGSRARALPRHPELVSVFGDSYAFCRQVEDQETWENVLSQRMGFSVGNYGVGNYGADQALLRYEQTRLPSEVRVVVLAFVPETICRVQSRWKHYLEFGNAFAFKPRFVLEGNGALRLMECPVRGLKDMDDLRSKLAGIQASDRFYRSKFRAVQFRRPYLMALLRHPVRQVRLLFLLALRRVARIASLSSQAMEEAPFAEIMRRNIRDAHRLYADAESTSLLRAILRRFAAVAAERGHQPLVVVMPQLLDLKCLDGGTGRYEAFFRDVAAFVPVLDLTGTFLQNECGDLYINDVYGGHLSVKGNALVAERVAEWLQEHLS